MREIKLIEEKIIEPTYDENYFYLWANINHVFKLEYQNNRYCWRSLKNNAMCSQGKYSFEAIVAAVPDKYDVFKVPANMQDIGKFILGDRNYPKVSLNPIIETKPIDLSNCMFKFTDKKIYAFINRLTSEVVRVIHPMYSSDYYCMSEDMSMTWNDSYVGKSINEFITLLLNNLHGTDTLYEFDNYEEYIKWQITQGKLDLDLCNGCEHE